jgi:hypothetical protein
MTARHNPRFAPTADSGPFASAAQELAEAGLAVIPCGGEKGKTPKIKTKTLRYRPNAESIGKMAQRYGNANVGVLTGKLSGVLVVDVDDTGVVDPMIERFGQTPLKTSTPSGGVHLWYRWNGERCSNLRPREGLKVDIKGAGGFVVVPPSVRQSTDKPYTWLRGSLKDLPGLPGVRPGALPEVPRVAPTGAQPAAAGTVKRGRRNNTLFKDLLREVRCCDSRAALQDVAEIINGTFDPPMSDRELAGVVGQVWKYETTGNNWNGGESMIAFTNSHMAILEAHPYGMALRVHLERKHGARTEPFALVAPAMANANCMPGWGWKSYKSATTWLVNTDFLTVVHKGGKCRGDAWLYKLSTPKK